MKSKYVLLFAVYWVGQLMTYDRMLTKASEQCEN